MLPTELPLLLTAAAIFAGELILNWLHARYTRAIADGHAVRPAVLAALSTAGGAVLWAAVLTQPSVTTVIAMSTGAALGTVLSARRRVG